jgi:YD repeat-containing protein
VPVTGPSLSYTYDAMGRLSTLSDTSSNVISSTTYGPAGELTAMSGAWGSESRSYNAMKQMTSLYSSGTSTVSIAYNYSSNQNNGKITSQYDYVSGETVAYTYDTLNRLATAGSSAWGQSYAYDGFGNLTDITSTLGTTPEWHIAYSAATNRGSGECSDANGNLCGSGLGYNYDVENRLLANGSNGLATAQYAYGPDNKRVWRGEWSSGTRTVNEAAFWSVTGQRVGSTIWCRMGAR